MTENTDPRLPLDTGVSAAPLDLPPPGPGKRRGLGLVALVVLAAGAGFFVASRRAPAPAPVATAALEAPFVASDVVGLARLMPRGDVAVVAAPYGSGDARVADILVPFVFSSSRALTSSIVEKKRTLRR